MHSHAGAWEREEQNGEKSRMVNSELIMVNEKESFTIHHYSSSVIAYFKGMAEETGIPYQRLINLYLEDCARKERTLKMVWESPDQSEV